MNHDESVPAMSLFLRVTARLVVLCVWLAIATAHAVVLALASLVLWVAQASPQTAWSGLLALASSQWILVGSLLFGGVSLLGAWTWAVRRIAIAARGRAWAYLGLAGNP